MTDNFIFAVILLTIVACISERSGEGIGRNEDGRRPSDDRNCRCNCCGQKGKSVTVVTALFDIGRNLWPWFKKSYENYLHDTQNILNLDVNLVYFIEEKGRIYIEENRRGKELKTNIAVTELKNLTFYRYITAIETIMTSDEFKSNHEQLNHPEGFAPLYNLVQSAKVSLLFEVALQNPFCSDYFFWMDAGYGHGRAEVFPHVNCPWVPCNILNDSVSFIKLHPTENYKHIIDELYKISVAPPISGGFFGGSKWAIQNYYRLYKAVLEDWLKRGKIDDDQTIALASYFKRPSLFNLVPGDWFDAFKVFK